MSAAHVHPDKADLRRRTLHVLRSLPPSERAQRSALVRARLLGLEPLARATGVALFLSLPGEVELDPLTEELVAQGKRVWLPRVDGPRVDGPRVDGPRVDGPRMDGPRMDGPRSMHFCAYAPGEPLVVARFGVREPAASAPAAAPGDIDLILVPGVAFDRRGARLGRGAGYYDRTLPAFRTSAVFAGICFAEQLFDRLPTDPWDCPMDLIVSDADVLVIDQEAVAPPGAG